MSTGNSQPRRARYTAAQMLSTGIHPALTTRPLRRGVTALLGSGANIAVLAGSEGTLLVDTGFAASRSEIATAVSHLSPAPIRHLLNTHWHFDHTDGNEWLQASGAIIVAQANTRTRLSQTQAIPAFDAVFTPRPSVALPSILFENELTVETNGETILLRRYSPAHTDSDLSVFFTKADILHTGDTWFNGMYPFTDNNSGGSISGMIAASAENLRLAGPETLVICGHGDLGSRDDLIEYHDMLLTVREKVSNFKAQGYSTEAVIAAKPTAGFDARRAGGFIPPDLFVSQVYDDV